ncbi:30S ribosomal protein S3 [Candidatus Gracilibacteria bacterium]|nr:30S ribosomal protein S3 [Candidatus Gracilibacteria bacterium]
MGQKVNPNSIRLKITKQHESKWYAPVKSMGDLVIEDKKIRDFLSSKLKEAGIDRFEIARTSSNVVVDIFTSKPGVVIGRQGAQIDELKIVLDNKFSKKFELNVREIKKPDLSAAVCADIIARAIEKRVPYRRAIKQQIGRTIDAGAKGVKVFIGGRLNGVEMARSEFYKEGNIPLHTFRSDIDYAIERANTTYGVLGIKVWIYKGEVF